MPEQDPGWWQPLRRFLPFIIAPGLLLKRAREDEPRVLALRTAVLAFVGALFGFLVVAVILFPLTADDPAGPVVYALVVAAPFTLLAIPWARGRLLDSCAPPPGLAAAYTTTMFLSIAFIESAALFGFVAMFLAEALWPYLVGMLVALIGFSRIAPTGARIRRLDESLARRGCQHSLRAGLFVPPDGDRASGR